MFSRTQISMAQIILMCRMQDLVNKTQHKMDWINESDFKRPDHRAAYIELVEGLIHKGWGEWWKQSPVLTESQLHQVRLEVVDVFHFLISLELRSTHALNVIHPDQAIDPIEYVSGVIHSAFEETPQPGAEIDEDQDDVDFDVNTYFDQLVGGLALDQTINWQAFVNIMDMLNMSPEYLFAWYVGKNTLNMFRGCNGYKQGRYVKSDWDKMTEGCGSVGAETDLHQYFGAEDNIFLEHIITDALAKSEKLTPQYVYDRLSDGYYEVLGARFIKDGQGSTLFLDGHIAWADTEDGIRWAIPQPGVNVDDLTYHDYNGWSGDKQPQLLTLG
ncbi:hypothetical protein GR7B_00182 [Vibrio phage vB_VcorM_GR7B]|nr:hypothetical protein GR7B_00182 [Vibrio phage vB_VcorM_GR7B]